MLFFFEHHGMTGKNLFRVNQMHNESFPSHLHRAYEIISVNAGTLSLQVEQKQYLLKKGELAFIFCNQVHSFSTPEQSDISVILFSPEIIGDFFSAYNDRVPVCNVVRLAKSQNFHSLKSIYARKSVLYHICDALLSSTEMESVGGRPQVAILQQIFAYVDKHFGEDCSLKRLSGSLQYDYAYLSKLFTRLAGMHFTDYLNNYRIAQACYMLNSGRQTISEIAYHCGYTTLRTFHRNFRSIVHCSPREYLARKRNHIVKDIKYFPCMQGKT